MSAKRLKIAIYAERFPTDGGGIAAAHSALYRLLKDNHDVRLFAFVDGSRSSNKEVVRGRHSPVLAKLMEWFLVGFVRKHDATGAIDECRKIAHAAATIRGMNKYLMDFDPDVVIVSDHRLPLLTIKKPPRAKFIWMAHHNYWRFRHQAFIDGPCDYDLFLAHRLERRAVQKADHVVFVSRYMERVFRETLQADLPGTTIPNILDLQQIATLDPAAIRKKMGLGPSDILVYVPSGGTQPKGSRFLGEIIRRLAYGKENVAFYVSGPCDSRTRAEMNFLNARFRIFNPGPVAHEENLGYVAAANLCVSPSVIENYSVALLEALALGLPCVVFDVGGNRELIVDGEHGHVVKFPDVDRLCEAASELIENEERREQFAAAAHKRGRKLGDPIRARQKYQELLTKLTAHGE